MKSRCDNPKNRKYRDYGARGIRVCARWLTSFDRFFADMGPKPSSKHSIDRINNEGNYEPGNCRWATPKEQSRNKRHHRTVQYNGQQMPLSMACELSGVNYGAALYRINRNLDWQPLPPPPDAKGG